MMIFMLSMCIVLPASAAEDTSTLSLWCVKDEEIVDGMHWQIFRVGHRETNDYVFEGAFANYRPTLGDTTKSMLEWDAKTVSSVANTLRVNALIDGLPCLSEGYTDEKGNLNFTGLEDGLYLVIGDSLDKGEKTYIPSSIFFEVNSEQENYLNAFPKIIYVTMNSEAENYSVRKVWANNENQPPALDTYITCEIYCDGELRETVRLDRTNNWEYRWTDKPGHDWLVREKEIPENYTVTYDGNHYQYIIVNTYDETITTETTTSTQKTTVTTTETSTVTTAKTTITSTEASKLPQTGQLWWPVLPLTGGGLLLIVAGAWIRKKDE